MENQTLRKQGFVLVGLLAVMVVAIFVRNGGLTDSCRLCVIGPMIIVIGLGACQ